jgi:hypothetical protein
MRDHMRPLNMITRRPVTSLAHLLNNVPWPPMASLSCLACSFALRASPLPAALAARTFAQLLTHSFTNSLPL